MPRDSSGTTTAETLARALDGSRHGRGWRCHCPAHDDAKASLDVTEGDDGKPLVTCRAGCDQADVIAALRSRGLWDGGSGGVNGTTFRHAAEEAVLVDVVPAGAPDLDIEAVLLGCRAIQRRGGKLVTVTPVKDGPDIVEDVRRIVRFDVKDPNGRLLGAEGPSVRKSTLRNRIFLG
jgi:hypothetical protein